jgi:outer membrane protein OmpA-like peptidoglycan-associated protein
MEVYAMKNPLPVCAGVLVSIAAACAQPSAPSQPQPIYRVTVVSRSLEAVNYEHRGGPTPIDFRGTVLLPHAKGTATVESHRGRVSIDAKLEHLEAPTRFGREYLTYVLWAITPQGRAKNLGELLVDSSNNAHIKVTTDLQAFGLIVTAEPYYSVTMPSDVVVAENVVRPDTIGAREEVTAKYELLPRGQYTMTVKPSQLHSYEQYGEKLSYDRYEAVLELYQAENAVQIARSLGADHYAPESFDKAASLLSQAQAMNARKQDTHAIVSTAREASQMAEDARTIAVRRRDEERRAEELKRQQDQSRLQEKADQEAAQAQAQADAERAEAERARIQAAQAQAAADQQAAAAEAAARRRFPPPPPQRESAVLDLSAARSQHRARVLAQLSAALETRDTPRGLVATVPDTMFEPGNDTLRSNGQARLVGIAAVLTSSPDLRVRVEGYGDIKSLTDTRARSVRQALVASGASPGAIVALGYGNTRPIASNATAAGRAQNRRVEVVVYGTSIGNRALWDHPYQLRSER